MNRKEATDLIVISLYEAVIRLAGMHRAQDERRANRPTRNVA